MTEHTEIERVLERWFDDGPSRMPDRVAVVVAERIDRQRQRRAWRLPWRFPTMSTPIKLIAAGAALLVVILGGAVFMGGGGPSLPAPTPTPSPSPVASTPSTTPSASAAFPAWFTPSELPTGAGILPAGGQTTRSFVPGFTFTVPEGWVNGGDESGFFGLFPDTPANAAEYAASEGMANEIFMGYPPNGSPYFVCDAWEDHRGTAAEMVASVMANDALAVAEPIDVTLGDLTGKQFDVQLDPAWTETCPGDPETFDIWDARTRALLLDTPDRGVLVIFVGSLHSEGHEAFLAEAMPIVESFQFDVTP